MLEHSFKKRIRDPNLPPKGTVVRGAGTRMRSRSVQMPIRRDAHHTAGEAKNLSLSECDFLSWTAERIHKACRELRHGRLYKIGCVEMTRRPIEPPAEKRPPSDWKVGRIPLASASPDLACRRAPWIMQLLYERETLIRLRCAAAGTLVWSKAPTSSAAAIEDLPISCAGGLGELPEVLPHDFQ